MTWTKLSDDFADDCYTLSPAARWLHVEGLIWSNRKLTDLRIDKTQMRRWATDPDAATELVDTGFWTDEGDHYLIRHHGMYQRTREQVLKQQEANQNNGKKGGRPPGTPRERKTHSVNESVSEWVSGTPDAAEEPRNGTHAGINGKPQVKTEWVSESLSESKTERDGFGTGLEGKHLQEGNQNEKRCRYCEAELPTHMKSQLLRGYCNRPACMEDAAEELAG